MARVIMDSFIKQNKQIYGTDESLDFNQRVLAVNKMYGWLNEQGILQKIALAYQNCPNEIYFALDAKALEPYRRAMEESNVPEAALAVRHLLDEPYTPCQYSGAIQPGWLMDSYRETDGIVGRSWECDLVKFLSARAANDVRSTYETGGVKAAVQKVFSMYDWPEMQAEKLPDVKAAEHEKARNVWICVYQDVLGRHGEDDNLTEICVPRPWLMEILKEEGLDPDTWFDEYTADDTQQIARRAMEEKVIVAFQQEEPEHSQRPNVGDGLASKLSEAKERAGRPNMPEGRQGDTPGKER